MKTQKSTRLPVLGQTGCTQTGNMKHLSFKIKFHVRGGAVMFGRITLIGLIICCIGVLPASAGTWRDDFGDGDLAGWEVWGEGNWKVESGELLLSHRDSTDLYAGEAGWSDYTVQADVMIVEVLIPRNQFPRALILARYQWPESPACYLFGLQWTPNHTVWGLSYYDANSVIHPGKLDPFPIEVGRWYNLRMTLAEGHIEAYLNNELIAEWDDKSEDSGKVGLHAKGIEVRFDNVVITGDEIPDVGPSGYATVEQTGKLATMWGSTKRGR